MGSFNPFSGQVKVEGIAPDQTPEIRVLSGAYMVGDYQVKQFYGHTAAAPLKPRSLTVYADVDGKTLIGQSQANGSITGDLTGKVDYETGYYEVAADKPLPPESVRYNAVSQAYIVNMLYFSYGVGSPCRITHTVCGIAALYEK